MQILVNKNIISADAPAIHSNDRGFLLGDGIFETIKVEDGNFLFFQEHYYRLAMSASQLDIPFRCSLIELRNQCQKLLKINSSPKIAALRITLTRGMSKTIGMQLPLTLSPTLVITITPYCFIPPVSTLYITNIKRNESSFITQLKTLSRLELVLARQKAIKAGYQEGLILNTKGAITETSTGNLFVVIDKQIFTPRTEDGILPGITRSVIIKIAARIKTPIIEKQLYPDDLLKASEIFQTNSLVEIQSFSKINEHLLLSKNKAIVTNQFCNQYCIYKKEYMSVHSNEVSA
ncbi:aminotransferase class IV [Coxiella-like endosymbiont of Amblyomma americanum]|uniref:aminotransferase class IV n=1 Tax=Coxiella-like endosymbiont of Amblyomma americanum TaxID=1987500 RepID=UPI000F89E0DB|nr:aminotransferase class IV [Coxiella-like endosymbiont of Amblyomma americanum]AUJ58691.1 4-amino-4-deoxychorismate lyase [Coxiella-like endosymbiont of Amblyomma americanum]